MKDYGSPYPVHRRRVSPRLKVFFSGSVIAIFVFISLLAVGLTLLPAAIDAELQRQIAVVEKSIGMEVKP